MAEYLEKSKMKQYVKNFFTGLKVDGDKFDEEDCCETICQIIDFAPAADVVEIVRCMYCKRSEKRNGNRYCTYWQDTVDPMHYCGKGDRREPLQK